VHLREGKVYCRLHASEERSADASNAASMRTSLAESAKLDTAHVDVGELCEAMIDKIVMMPPTCVACGGTFGLKVRRQLFFCVGALLPSELCLGCAVLSDLSAFHIEL
jgi:hypothetical protein